MKTLKLIIWILIISMDIIYLVCMLCIGFSMIGQSYEGGVYSNSSPIVILVVTVLPFLLGCFTIISFTLKNE